MVKLRQARKIRSKFYRAYRALEAWRQFKWDQNEGPVLMEVLGSLTGMPLEPAKPLQVPPLLRRLRHWPQRPANHLIVKAMRRLNTEERTKWMVDLSLWNAMVKMEAEPHSGWMTTAFPSAGVLHALMQESA